MPGRELRNGRRYDGARHSEHHYRHPGRDLLSYELSCEFCSRVAANFTARLTQLSTLKPELTSSNELKSILVNGRLTNTPRVVSMKMK